MNDFFDLFNSKVPRIDCRPRMAAYGLESSEQDKILSDFEDLMRSMKVGTNQKRQMLPFQKGFLGNITALKMLFNDLRNDYDASYILTYRINQDPLEHFFSVLRSKGGAYDHPDCLEFKYRLRSFILCKNDLIISDAACVNNDNDPKVNFECFSQETFQCETEVLTTKMLESIISPNELVVINEDDEDGLNLNNVEYDSLEYLGGYILKRLRTKLPHLVDKYSDKNSSTFTFVEQKSEGFLIKPTMEFIAQLEKMNSIFNRLNEGGLKPKSNYIKDLMSVNVDVDERFKKIFYRCKMFFNIRISNQKIKDSSLSRKRKFNKILN